MAVRFVACSGSKCAASLDRRGSSDARGFKGANKSMRLTIACGNGTGDSSSAQNIHGNKMSGSFLLCCGYELLLYGAGLFRYFMKLFNFPHSQGL